ncbi:regulatory protein MarR [Gemmatirosa kalamazoonensis]|jgi:DNA-binding MarR family transcriptional regulator|uniref:Regulatory protein MarR n=1 Tax=Gemmatirosa kalamazoonensis TaxID=861299 RepID=W0RCZ6_9BACT|nr:MarR family transcriptional regulator [Gemmatirosa kalamazoonensis]AHG88307.1 regulatory protein MarR [Gemmatirosa kalamazoonensis]
MTSRLQVELKQTKPFPSRASEATLGLLRTAAIIEHAQQEALRPFGITGTQYNVLRILRGAGDAGLCGREVGERMITRVPDIPRLLERMEEAGLINRTRDSDDRRHVIARITAAGLRVIDDVAPVLDALERRFFGDVAPELVDGLIDALDEVRAR